MSGPKPGLVLTWLDGAAKDGRPYHSPAEAAAAIRRLIAERDGLRAKLAQAVDDERVVRGLLLLQIEEAIADGGPSRGADWLADMRAAMGATSYDELRGMVAGLLKTKGAGP